MTIDDEVRRAARLLDALIQATGTSREELERRLEASPGYVNRLLAGRVELKLRHIVAILRALEIEPGLFFQTLYPGAGPVGGTVRMDELRQRLEELGFEGKAAPARPEIGMDDLERLVQGAVQAVLSRREPRD
ncbi:MAG TPA: helix-turn-helix transcriptional regulator [Thermoanaerobaculia bacterium]|nr:helix-turn-helix transcriptional regulator [Thermoanaerobaculia bacterium]